MCVDAVDAIAIHDEVREREVPHMAREWPWCNVLVRPEAEGGAGEKVDRNEGGDQG